MNRRLRRVALAVTAVAVVAIAGAVTYAVADIGGGGVINGCYKSQGGQLRVVDPATDHCLPSETPISWGGAAAVTYHVRSGAALEGGTVAQAFCLPGEKVTGGGGLSVPNDAGLTQNHPIADQSGLIAFDTNAIGWQVGTEGFGPVQAYVVCAS